MKEFIISLIMLISLALTAHSEEWELSFNEKLQLPAHDTLQYGLFDQEENRIAQTTVIYNLTEEGLWISDSINESEILIDEKSLMPIEGTKVFNSSQGRVEIRTVFDGDSIRAHMTVDAGEEDRTIAVSEIMTIHNDQLLFTTPAIDFGQKKHNMKLFVPASVTLIGMALIVNDPVEVEIPAGKFEAYPIRFDFGMGIQEAWYEVAEPHRMLIYDNGRIQYRLEKS